MYVCMFVCSVMVLGVLDRKRYLFWYTLKLVA